METERVGNDDAQRAWLRGMALWFLLTAVVFFPMIFNPVLSGVFGKSGAERLAHIEGHLGALRLLFTGIGLTELSLGAALWTWGRHVARRSSGRSATTAGALAWVSLAAGVLALASRLASSWFQSAADMASDDLSALEIVLFLPAAIGFSLSVIVFGGLMVRGTTPTWLGALWIACGVLFWLGILPLWFFVAALVFGVWGLVHTRPGMQGPAPT